MCAWRWISYALYSSPFLEQQKNQHLTSNLLGLWTAVFRKLKADNMGEMVKNIGPSFCTKLTGNPSISFVHPWKGLIVVCFEMTFKLGIYLHVFRKKTHGRISKTMAFCWNALTVYGCSHALLINLVVRCDKVQTWNKATLDNKEQKSKLNVASNLILSALREIGFERFGYSYFWKVFSLSYDMGKVQNEEHWLWKTRCKLPLLSLSLVPSQITFQSSLIFHCCLLISNSWCGCS